MIHRKSQIQLHHVLLLHSIGAQGWHSLNTAPKICLHYVKSATLETDIYSWAITVYEILSGISPPWSKVLAFLNVTVLTEALCLDKQPPVEDLYKYYHKCYVLLISPVILSCLHGSPKNRLIIGKVIYIYYIFTANMFNLENGKIVNTTFLQSCSCWIQVLRVSCGWYKPC